MAATNTFTQDLVLLGGGHTHVLLIKRLAMRPISGVRVTLVSDKSLTPYSGMLPGFVAGHYSLVQTNIDLNRLCRRAGVRWVRARCTGLDVDINRAYLEGQPDINFDVLSLDIGSTPDQGISGASEFAVGVKPIASFQRRWNALLQTLDSTQSRGQASASIEQNIDWGVIGAGAGGVELVLAMSHRLKEYKNLKLHLIFRGERVLPGYPSRVANYVEQSLHDYGVTLHRGFSVTTVTDTGVINDVGKQLNLHERIWCTGAVGAPWLNSGSVAVDHQLAVSDKHFIKVNRTLQSTSHKHVFAAGDIAEMIDDPRPKAGVFAVRQAPFLEQNLRRFFTGEPLIEINLQKNALSLLALGGKTGVASRNGLALKGKWVWRWKDSIDQAFMDQFTELPMTMSEPVKTTTELESDAMPCGGCGSKLGPNLLATNLDITSLASAHEVEDATLWTPTPGMLTLQSLDGFRSFISDESTFARICVNHALSDIYAMGASATRIQAWVNLAFNSRRLQQRDHLRVLRGIQAALAGSPTTLSGGHSSEGLENHLGIVANGELKPGTEWAKSGAQAGDLIVLSKSLGTGVVMAADMQGEATADSVDASIASMLLSNQQAMQQLHHVGPNAVTDVTGFGLLGHLLEMLDGANKIATAPLVADLTLSAIPTLSGALELVEAGWRSSLYPQLEPYLLRCQFSGKDSVAYSNQVRHHLVEILLDPQTSGGLLATINKTSAALLLNGKSDFVVIGKIKEKPGDIAHEVDITLND